MAEETLRAENLEGQEVTEALEAQETGGQTYTEEDFQKKLQSETDKRVTEAIKKREEVWRAEWEKKLEAEKTEAERLAKMNADERARAEFEKERKAFEEERAKLEKDRLEVEVRKSLRDEHLAEDFAPFLMGTSADEAKANIDAFKAAWEKAVEEAVKEQLKGSAPKAGTGSVKKDAWDDLRAKYR